MQIRSRQGTIQAHGEAGYMNEEQSSREGNSPNLWQRIVTHPNSLEENEIHSAAPSPIWVRSL